MDTASRTGGQADVGQLVTVHPHHELPRADLQLHALGLTRTPGEAHGPDRVQHRERQLSTDKALRRLGRRRQPCHSAQMKASIAGR